MILHMCSIDQWHYWPSINWATGYKSKTSSSASDLVHQNLWDKSPTISVWGCERCCYCVRVTILYIVLTMPMKVICYRLRLIFLKINSVCGIISVAVLNVAIFLISEDYSKDVTLD